MTLSCPPLAPLTGHDQRVPLVQGGSTRYANLDYAASAPALAAVTEQVSEVLPLYASVHRGAGYTSQVCTAAYEAARAATAAFVGARADDVAVFTRNTTDALNLLAAAVPGPVVHLDTEHHANLLPWHGRVIQARPTLAATLDAVEAALIRRPTALLTVTGASNVTGECLPLDRLAAIAHRHGARIAVDGAQLVPHRRVDIGAAGLDYLAFSGHKMYAPFGAGALVGRRDWLDAAPPYLAGGGAVRSVSLGLGWPGSVTPTSVRWADAPARHEAGTPNVIGAVALATACRVLAAYPADAIVAHESALLRLLREGLESVGARTYRIWPDTTDHVPVVTFEMGGVPAARVAAYLSAEHGIGVRDGRFCAHPLLARLGASDGAVRVSLGLGSRSDDIDRLITALDLLRTKGPAWTYTADHRPYPDPRPMPAWAPAVDGGEPACAGGQPSRGGGQPACAEAV
jgi:selenocysteine lyase/cysteine desulfurase